MTITTRIVSLAVIAISMVIAAVPPAVAASSGIFNLNVAIGKACWAQAYTNAGATWTMTIKDGSNVVAVFEGRAGAGSVADRLPQ